MTDPTQVVNKVDSEVQKEVTAFQKWVPIGDHRWWVWIGVAFVVGFLIKACVV